MIYKGVVYVFLFTLTLTSAQFFYNYEQENPETEEPEMYNPSEYKYNPPSAVERHFLRTIQAPPERPEQPEPRAYEAVEIPIERPRRRQQSSSRRYRPQPAEAVIEDYGQANQKQPPEYMAEVRAEPMPEERPVRQSRRRQSIPQLAPPVEIIEPPKYYGPSVFEDIPLGQAPSGVFVPHDSLLNLIKKSPSYTPQSQPDLQYAPENNAVDIPATPVQSVAVYRPEPYFVTAPPTMPRTSYAQPVVNYAPPAPPQPISSEPTQPEEYNEQLPPPPSTQPSHRPSSQEIPQDEYRRQRKVQRPQIAPQPRSRPQVAPQPRPRPQVAPQPRSRPQVAPQPRSRPQVAPQPRSRPQRRSRQQSRPIPQPVVEYQEPPQQNSNAEIVEEYPNDIRRSPRRPQETTQQTRRQQVAPAVSASPENKRQRTSQFKPANLAIATLPEDADEDGIPGVAGVDYPTLHVIPSTSFSCSSQEHSGYYADLETSCQVVHLCQSGGVQDSFLCPNGTIFSQEKFSCQWWYKVNCQNSPRYYSINDRLYKVPEVKKRNEKERS